MAKTNNIVDLEQQIDDPSRTDDAMQLSDEVKRILAEDGAGAEYSHTDNNIQTGSSATDNVSDIVESILREKETGETSEHNTFNGSTVIDELEAIIHENVSNEFSWSTEQEKEEHLASTISRVEELWSELAESWPAIQQQPVTVAKIEELWNYLKQGDEGVLTFLPNIEQFPADTSSDNTSAETEYNPVSETPFAANNSVPDDSISLTNLLEQQEQLEAYDEIQTSLDSEMQDDDVFQIHGLENQDDSVPEDLVENTKYTDPASEQLPITETNTVEDSELQDILGEYDLNEDSTEVFGNQSSNITPPTGNAENSDSIDLDELLNEIEQRATSNPGIPLSQNDADISWNATATVSDEVPNDEDEIDAILNDITSQENEFDLSEYNNTNEDTILTSPENQEEEFEIDEELQNILGDTEDDLYPESEKETNTDNIVSLDQKQVPDDTEVNQRLESVQPAPRVVRQSTSDDEFKPEKRYTQERYTHELATNDSNQGMKWAAAFIVIFALIIGTVILWPAPSPEGKDHYVSPSINTMNSPSADNVVSKQSAERDASNQDEISTVFDYEEPGSDSGSDATQSYTDPDPYSTAEFSETVETAVYPDNKTASASDHQIETPVDAEPTALATVRVPDNQALVDRINMLEQRITMLEQDRHQHSDLDKMQALSEEKTRLLIAQSAEELRRITDASYRDLARQLDNMANSTSPLAQDQLVSISNRLDRLEAILTEIQLVKNNSAAPGSANGPSMTRDEINSLLRDSRAGHNDKKQLNALRDRLEKLERALQSPTADPYRADIKKDSNVVTITLNKPTGSSTGNGTYQVIEHTVIKGDTLWAIAKRYVDNPFLYPELARLSNINNPDRIYPGDQVRIIRFTD